MKTDEKEKQKTKEKAYSPKPEHRPTLFPPKSEWVSGAIAELVSEKDIEEWAEKEYDRKFPSYEEFKNRKGETENGKT